MRAPLLYQLYVVLTVLLVPFAARNETRKLRRAGVPVTRAHEKLGHATEERRGSGPFVWFHAASVGESLSVLSLIGRMGEMLPRARFLITSGTATSAQMVEKRLPPRCVHQFAPLDAPGPLKRFLVHWRPDAAIFVESEIWPQMLRRTRARGAKMALVNARLSAKSVATWKKAPTTARYVFDVFDLILTQNDEMAQAMVNMNAPPERVARGVNLKSLSTPLPKDPALLARVRTALKGRPVWVAASTHKGEEEIVLRAHQSLLAQHPDLLLILAPRHPDRSAEVQRLVTGAGLTSVLRSRGDFPRSEQVYLADSLGELGSWYDLTGIVFLGGSLLPVGGHNPYEVAQSGAAVLSGPHVFNFAETYAELTARGAVTTVADADALTSAVLDLLANPGALVAARKASTDFVRDRSDQLGSIATRLIRALSLDEDRL
jgi:3-deoxy-D-manno-octulosonic-acid transferase